MILRTVAVTAAIAAAVLSAPLAATPRPSQLIVFGDSLVDAGNLDIAVGSDVFNPVSSGYFPGRFTNGPDYTDLLNQRLYGSYQTPALALTGGTNYAFGGARIVDTGDTIPDLVAQLGLYTSFSSVDPNALYIINLGGNDVFGLQANDIGSFTPASYAANLVATLTGAVQALDAAGAGHILVTGIPNTTPTGFALDAQVEAGLDAIQPGLHNAELLRFSYLDFLTRLAADPLKFGVPAITQPGACFDSRTPVNGSIDCSGFATVDGTHPIAQIQAAIFRQVAHITGVGAVPEPATWTMMIAGFFMVGTAVRRRKPLRV